MTEKEKCLLGMLYNSGCEELTSERKRCKELCFEYNNLSVAQTEKRKNLIRKIVKSCGENFLIEPSFWCDYGYNIKFGENFYSNHNLVILDCAKVEFGDNVFIGPNCGFYTAGHPLNVQERNLNLEYAKAIKVGNNVWIGGGVTVIGGVTIGDNSVIGAGSVVVGDIPENVVACGNPCKVMKKI